MLIAHVKTKISVVNNVIYFHASNNLKPLEKKRKKLDLKPRLSNVDLEFSVAGLATSVIYTRNVTKYCRFPDCNTVILIAAKFCIGARLAHDFLTAVSVRTLF